MKTKLLFILFSMGFFMMHHAEAQDRTISGKVTSTEDGSALPGVNVLVKGTTIGTVTDIDGNYKLNVPADEDMLVFSFIGLAPEEVPIGARSVIDIQMAPDVKQLSEVVVTAIGIESSKRSLGYSIQEVKADEIVKSRETNLVSALSGKAAGVQVINSTGTPGGSAQIRIRGNKSFQGSNSALFVVDGVPIDNSSFSTVDSPEDAVSDLGSGGVNNSNRAIDINPNDIASLTVLKGPAATALYGIRAANGAVIITTKKGGREQKPTINFSTSFSIDRVNKLPDLQKVYAQGNPVNGVPTFQGPMTGSFTGFSWGPRIDQLRYSDTPSMWDRNGLIVPAGDPRATDRVANAYDNEDDFFETGQTLSNNLSFSGGTEKTNYYLSVGRLDQTGIIPNSDYARTSFKATIGTNITEKFKATFSANYVNSEGERVQQGSNTSGVMLGLLRTTPSFDNSNGFGEDGDENPAAYSFPDLGGLPRSYRGLLGERAIYDNPFWTVNKNTQLDEVNRLIGYAQLAYEFLPWLTVTYRIGVDVYADERKFRNDIGSGTFPAGQVINHLINNRDINSDLLMTINKDISDDLNLNATVGHNYFNKEVSNNRIEGQGLASREFYNIASAGSIIAAELPERKELFGVYADLKFSFRDQLFLNLTGRNDWSSTLPDDENSFFYPAVSAGWVFTETLGMSRSKFLPYAKVRASWGKVGNDALFALTTTGFTQARVRDGWTTPNGVLFPALGNNSFIPESILGNNELKPEFTTTVEAGLDLRFWEGRITMDATYYKATSEDMIITVDIPASGGFLQRAINAGEIVNEGIEVAINSTLIESNNFTYDLGLNFNHYTNIVERMPEGLPFITIDPFGTQRIAEGEPYGVFFGSRFLRDDQGRMVIGTDGIPLEDPNEGVVGDPTPDFTIGIRNTLSFKGLSLSFLLDIREGGDVYNGTKGVLWNFGVHEETLDRNELVVFPGVKADADGNPTDIINDQQVVKGGTDGGTNFYQNYGFVGLTELTVEDGSWIRLRELNLSYALPSSLIERTPFRNIDIGFSARNVFLITDYTGIDPETNLTGDASNVLGYDYFNNPNTRSFGVNLNLTL